MSVIWSLEAVRPHPESPPSTPLGAAWLPEHIRGTGVWGWPPLCWSPRLPEPGLHRQGAAPASRAPDTPMPSGTCSPFHRVGEGQDLALKVQGWRLHL